MTQIKNFTEIAFTDSVKEVQVEQGSRTGYSKMEQREFSTEFTQNEAEFIAARDSFYLSTSNKEGWPYVQFRGGPTGFLKVLGAKHFGFADYKGNRQYVSTGNIKENSKVSLFLMDYVNKRRLKIWARAKILELNEENDQLFEALFDKDYKVKIERLIMFELEAFDWNCPQHIPQKYTLEQIAQEIGVTKLDNITDLKTLLK
jgi:predicted pyridoxine 5'-phosphate oxidase superfamily flavin-nucleotide-binding protein